MIGRPSVHEREVKASKTAVGSSGRSIVAMASWSVRDAGGLFETVVAPLAGSLVPEPAVLVPEPAVLVADPAVLVADSAVLVADPPISALSCSKAWWARRAMASGRSPPRGWSTTRSGSAETPCAPISLTASP